MKTFRDFRGRNIRLTDERRKHILEHPEMKGMLSSVKETLLEPQRVIQSVSDHDANLYY